MQKKMDVRHVQKQKDGKLLAGEIDLFIKVNILYVSVCDNRGYEYVYLVRSKKSMNISRT
jgi:hypothetical protein